MAQQQTTQETEALIRFTCRMPISMHKKLAKVAKKEKRSMNAQAIKAMETALQKAS